MVKKDYFIFGVENGELVLLCTAETFMEAVICATIWNSVFSEVLVRNYN